MAVSESDEFDGANYAVVVAIDPGGTTGFSVIMVHPDSLTDPDVAVLQNILWHVNGQVDGPEVEQAMQVAELADAWEGAALLIEDFILREFSMGRELLSPVRITSMIEFHCVTQYEPVRPIFKQSSNDVMSPASDERLKRWGLYDRKSGVHARDADRHAIMFMKKAKKSPALRVAAWPHIFGADDEPPRVT